MQSWFPLCVCVIVICDAFPTLLFVDSCFMIDRRMGIYGCRIKIQAISFLALCNARILLKPELGGAGGGERNLLNGLISHHMHIYFWLDHKQLNNMHWYKSKEYSHPFVNKINVLPDSIWIGFLTVGCGA
jgi:hypothetical protein